MLPGTPLFTFVGLLLLYEAAYMSMETYRWLMASFQTSDAIIIIVTNVGYIGIGGKSCDDTSCILYSLPSFDNTMN